jgi:hypothetical protein
MLDSKLDVATRNGYHFNLGIGKPFARSSTSGLEFGKVMGRNAGDVDL